MKNSWSLLTISALLVLSASLVGCGGTRSDASEVDESAEEEVKVPVETISLETGPIESILKFSSQLEAEASIQVLSEAAREVKQLYVEEGDRVAKGALLVRLDDDEQRTAVAKMRAQLARSQREMDRQKHLFEQNLISERAMNDASYELEQLEFGLADAERALSYTEVRAPISGTVTLRQVKVGDHVMVNQHLFNIVDFSTLVARLYVPENDMVKVKSGQEVRLSPATDSLVRWSGQVDRIAPVVDPGSGTVKVTVKVPAGNGLKPGMFLQAELVTAVDPAAKLLPKRALVWDGEQAFVFVLNEDNQVNRRRVIPLLENADYLSVGEDFSLEDRIVVAGQAGLKEGTTVEIIEADHEQG